MFMLPLVLNIFFFLAGLVFNSTAFAMKLLRAADFLDGYSGLGVPIFKVLAYSLLVRSAEDTVPSLQMIDKLGSYFGVTLYFLVLFV